MFEKMSIGELQLHIGQLLIEYSNTGVCPAHLCIWEGKLQVRWCGHTSIPHPSFLKFTSTTLRRGLTASQWDVLTQSIYNYFRRNEPCQKQSSPSRTQKQQCS